MSYITKEMVGHILKRMISLESEMNAVYENHGLSFRANAGRRNAIISQIQEIATAESLNIHGELARVDGRTGYPDVCVDSMHREIECKLTSGSGGSWSLQADYSTLERKGALDFLYILANPEFDEFAVLFFEGLTRDDFHPPSPGAREKARMNKINAMEKCTVLMGNVSNKNMTHVNQYREDLKDLFDKTVNKMVEIDLRIEETTAQKKLTVLRCGRDNTVKRFLKKAEKIGGKIEYWQTSPLQFSIELERLDE